MHGNLSMASLNDDSFSSFKHTTSKKNEKNFAGVSQSINRVVGDHRSFYKELYQFHENKGFVLLNYDAMMNVLR